MKAVARTAGVFVLLFLLRTPCLADGIAFPPGGFDNKGPEGSHDRAIASSECVVLLHGLARTSNSMTKLRRALEAEGYAVTNVDYPSRKLPIEQLAPIAVGRGIERCRNVHATKIHFVAHSLGGILVRYYLARNTVPELGRVVMLGPPNQGSEVVDNLAGVPGYAEVNGPAGFELGTGPASVPNTLGAVSYPVGVIAGTESVNPILSTSFTGPNDGKVSVERAKVDGMSDFIALPTSHPFMMRNAEAIRQTVEFIGRGRFAHKTP